MTHVTTKNGKQHRAHTRPQIEWSLTYSTSGHRMVTRTQPITAQNVQ